MERLNPAMEMAESHNKKNEADVEKKSRDYRSLFWLVAGRSFLSINITLMGLASPQILLDVNKKSETRANKSMAIMDSATALVAFLIRPIAGQIVDTQGRLYGLIGGTAGLFVLKIFLLWKENEKSFLAYRMLSQIFSIPLFQSFLAIIAEKFGGMDNIEFMRFNRVRFMWLAFVRLATLYFAGKIKRKKVLLAVSAASVAGSGMAFYFGVNESHKENERSSIDWGTAIDPLFSVRYFRRSRKLKALALLNITSAIEGYNNTFTFYQRARYGWEIPDHARFQQVSNVAELIGPMFSIALQERIGLKWSAISSELSGAACNLITALSNTGSLVYLNPFVESVFESDALNALASVAVSSSDLAQLVSAQSNLLFPLSFFLPRFYSELFTYSQSSKRWKNLRIDGAAPFIFVSLVKFINAAFIIPYAFRVIMQE